MSELSQWRKRNGFSQQEMAKKLGYGTKWTTYAAQERGDNAFPPKVEAKLRDMEFHGKMPQDEGAAAPAYVTVEAFSEYKGEIKERFRVLEADVEEAWEVIRALTALVPPESRPKAPTGRRS